MSNATRKPKGWLIAGIVCLVLSLGGCTASVSAIAALGGGVDRVMTPTPFGETSEFTSTSDTGALVILSESGECRGTDGSGAELSFDDPISDVPAEADGQSLEFARTFETEDGESYRVTCDAVGSEVPADAEFTILRLPKFPFGLVGLLVAIGGGAVLGVLLFLLGIIFVIVGLIKRSNWKRRQSRSDASLAEPPAPPVPTDPPDPGPPV